MIQRYEVGIESDEVVPRGLAFRIGEIQGFSRFETDRLRLITVIARANIT